MPDPVGQLTSRRGRAASQLVVPKGTRLSDLLKVHEQLDHKILPHISPGGCGPCLSGIPFVVIGGPRQVARVDLNTGQVAHQLVRVVSTSPQERRATPSDRVASAPRLGVGVL